MIKPKPLAAVLAATAAVVTAALLWPTTHTNTAPATPTPSTAASTILHLSGEGSAVTAGFTTGPDWAVLYSFTCPNAAAFRVIEQGSVSDGVPLADRTGMQGTGTAYVHNETGGHRLRVMSACMWTLTVVNGDVMPRATGGAA